MSDSALSKFYTYGTNAERLAFVPDPPPGVNVLYIWYETDTTDIYIYDGSSWILAINASPAGDVTGGTTSVDRSIAVYDGTTGKVLTTSAPVITTTGRITTVTNPTGAQDAATKSYVDAAVSGSTGTLSTLSFITVVTETINAPNSRLLAAGTGLDLDTTAAGIISVVLETNQRMRSFGITVDGGGSVFTTGTKGYIRVPYSGTISKWTLMADTIGNVTVNIYKDTIGNYPPVVSDTITATTPPSLTATYVRETTSLPSWVTTVTAGDIFAFNVDTVTTMTRVTLVVDVTLS